MTNFTLINPSGYSNPNFGETGTEFCNPWEGDAIPDEAFEEAELFASASPKSQLPPDLIENLTVQIFTRLRGLVDEDDFKDIEAAMEEVGHSSSSSEEQEHSTHRVRPFRRETSFSDESYDQPVHIRKVMHTIMSALANIFLGWQLSNLDQKKTNTLEEAQEIISTDKLMWKQQLREHYNPEMHTKMKQAFQLADDLLKTRHNEKEKAYFQRITFYATLIIAALGKYLGSRVMMVLGLIGASITLIMMGIHYGTTSFRESEQKSLLITTINRAYSTANLSRLD